MNQPIHRSKSKKNKPSRKVKPVILIVCEGKSTEFNYIGGIKNELRLSNVHIKGPYSDPKTLLRETQKLLKQKEEIDTAYCVFDHDGRKSFGDALKLIDLHNKKDIVKIEAITSNPCFEIWVLLHYAYSTKPHEPPSKGISSSKALIKAIHKHLPGYSKNSPTIYQQLKPKTPQAIKNAEKLSVHQGHDCTKNPYTDLPKLVQMLLQLSDSE